MKSILAFTSLLIFSMFVTVEANAQVRARVGIGRRVIMRNSLAQKRNMQRRKAKESFKPSVNIGVGYGLPNLDKNYLPSFYNAAMGNVQQTGVVAASLDYHLKRNMSIGFVVTHGSVSAPYYNYSNPSNIAVNAKLESWSYMLNLVHYMQGNKTVTPYFRTAFGMNSWKQNYTDVNNNAVEVIVPELPDLTYQASLGAKVKLSSNAAFTMEAGYGKYIVQAGLSFKF